MPRKKKSFFTDWQENYAGLILGAVIVVIIGLLVANFLTNRNNQQIGNGQQTGATNQESPSPTPYKVATGDSLSKIAEQYYQDKAYWPVLAKVNKIANPNIIYADSTLEIPTKNDADQIKAQMTQTTYNVQAGDTLFTIAEKMYGDGSRWPLIASANNLGRLPNGNPLVFADSTIKIPR